MEWISAPWDPSGPELWGGVGVGRDGLSSSPGLFSL